MNFAVIADDISFPRLFDMIGQWQGEVVACSGKVGRKQLLPGVILGWEPSSETPQGVEVVLASGVVPTVATAVPSLVRQGWAVWLIPESVLGSDFVYAQIPLDEEFPDQLRSVSLPLAIWERYCTCKWRGRWPAVHRLLRRLPRRPGCRMRTCCGYWRTETIGGSPRSIRA